MNIHLAKALVKENIISLDQVRAAIEQQRQTNKGLGEILINLGYMDETQLLDFLSKEYGVPAANLDEFEIEPVVLKLVPRKTVVEHGIMPIALSGNDLLVAMSDPSNIIAVDDLRFATGYNIRPVVAPETAIRSAIEKHYGTNNEPKDRIKGDRNEETIEDLLEELEDLKRNMSLSDDSSPSEAKEKEELHQEKPAAQDDDITSEREDSVGGTAPTTTLDPFSAPSPTYSHDPMEPGSMSGEPAWQPYPFNSHEGEADQRGDTGVIDEEKFEGYESMGSDRESELLTSEGAETNFNPGNTSADDTDSEETPETEDTLSGEIENILAPFNPPLLSQDSESSSSEDGANLAPEEEIFDQNSFFSQVYGNWEKPDETNLPSSQDEKVSMSDNTTELDETVDSDRSEEFAVEGENDLPGSTLSEDYESESDCDQGISESAPEDTIDDSFSSTSSSQTSHSSPAEEVPTKATEGVHSSDSDELYSFTANAFTTPPINSVEEEKEAKDESVVMLHKETVAPSEAEEHSSQITVLVVDDSPTVQKIVSITLERRGYQVFTAANAMQALAKLNEIVPDLIFVDINLPHMDGYKLCKVIKDNGPTKDIPIVMLSGKDKFFDKVRGRMVGATDYITKPFEPNTLIRAVEKHRK